MNRYILFASVTFMSLTVSGLAGSAIGGNQVPLRGVLEGEELLLAPPPHAILQGVGIGSSTQLGLFSYVFDATVDFGNLPPQGIGTLTLTAANGDTLVVGIVGSSKPEVPGILLVTEMAIVLEGTGRFAGASGDFTITRLKYQDTGLTIGSFEGTISSPGIGRP